MIDEIAMVRAEYERKIAALWHFSTCPYDHCQRCCDDEKLIKSIRDEMRAAGERIPYARNKDSGHEETD